MNRTEEISCRSGDGLFLFVKESPKTVYELPCSYNTGEDGFIFVMTVVCVDACMYGVITNSSQSNDRGTRRGGYCSTQSFQRFIEDFWLGTGRGSWRDLYVMPCM